MTLITPLIKMFCHRRLGFDVVCLRAKVDDFSSAVPEILQEASKFKVGHVPLTTPLLRAICHPYAATSHSLHACKI